MTIDTQLRMDREPSFRKEPYTEHLARLEAACKWLAVDRGRAFRYRRLVREFFAKGARSREHILAYGESCEIVDMFELWEHRLADFPELEPKIKRVFSKGPLLREDESAAASSNRPRNDAFGYFLAGSFLAADVCIVAVDGIVARGAACESDADLTFQWGERLIDVECKRPQTLRALAQRTKEAREQLARPGRGGREGVIAVDCSVLVRPPGKLLESESGESGEDLVSSKLEKIISPKVVRFLTNSIIGFFLFARVPAMARVRRLPIVTSLGKPIHEFRPDCISTWLVVSNSKHGGSDILRGVARRLAQLAHNPVGNIGKQEDTCGPTA